MSDGTEAIGSKRPTIRDVAREAGVSIGTVSAVINQRGLVAEDTKRHVLRFIAELGFEPNNAARNLKRSRISSIGFVVPDLGNPFFASIAEGIQRGIADNDILLMLCITWSKTEREEYFASILRTQRLDGVIYLSGTGLPSSSLLELAKVGSVVFVDEVLPGLDVPFVGSNNLAGARPRRPPGDGPPRDSRSARCSRRRHRARRRDRGLPTPVIPETRQGVARWSRGAAGRR